MSSKIVGLRVAGTIFALMCLAQLARLVTKLDILIAGYRLPFWPSGLAFVILASLSFWMWMLTAENSK